MHNDAKQLEALILMAMKLSALQMRLGTLALEAALAFGKGADFEPQSRVPMLVSQTQIDAAADALKAKMLKGCEVGFGILLRTNFSDDHLREMAKAALEAAIRNSE